MTNAEGQLADFFKQGGSNVIGAVVMWALSGVRVNRDDLRAALDEVGLAKAMPKDPRPERLLGKAVEASRAGAKGLLFRKLSKRNWAIVEERENADGMLDLRHTLTIGVEEVTENAAGKDFKSFRPTLDIVVGASVEAQALAGKVREAYWEASLYANTEDLSIVLTQAMSGTDVNAMLGAISLRQGSGGVYFVPGPQVERVRKLQRLVDDLDGGSHVTVLALYGDAGNLEEAATAARSSFTAKLNDLRGELGVFVETMKEGEKEMTDAHVQTRVRRLGALQDRVEVWSGALGDVQAELQTSIEDAKTEVGKAMGL